MALGVPGRLRPRIISTFGTTRVERRQPYAPVAFTPGEIPGTHFQRLSRPQGTWFCRKEPQKKSPVTPPGIDPETVRLVAKRLKHYATPGPYTLGTGFFFSDASGRGVICTNLHQYLPSSAEVKNELSYTFILPIYLHGIDRDKFTFTLFVIPITK